MALGAYEQNRTRQAQEAAVKRALRVTDQSLADIDRLAPELRQLYGKQQEAVDTGFAGARGALSYASRMGARDIRAAGVRANADATQNLTSRGLANTTVLSSVLGGNGLATARALADNRARVAAASGELDLAQANARTGLHGAYMGTLMGLTQARLGARGQKLAVYTGQDISGAPAGAIGGAFGSLGKAFDTVDWGNLLSPKSAAAAAPAKPAGSNLVLPG
ncbi:MAG: hypothetical protein EKK62_09580 [Acidimicrobiia bacterium]|nr:MAG: hypothetical protein EKK62_09580 [Acidimicrobiia bacterium]